MWDLLDGGVTKFKWILVAWRWLLLALIDRTTIQRQCSFTIHSTRKSSCTNLWIFLFMSAFNHDKDMLLWLKLCKKPTHSGPTIHPHRSNWPEHDSSLSFLEEIRQIMWILYHFLIFQVGIPKSLGLQQSTCKIMGIRTKFGPLRGLPFHEFADVCVMKYVSDVFNVLIRVFLVLTENLGTRRHYFLCVTKTSSSSLTLLWCQILHIRD